MQLPDKLLIKSLTLLIYSACWLSCTQKSSPVENNSLLVSPSSLPFTILPLTGLEAFTASADNWQIAGRVTSDFTKTLDISVEKGIGVLANVTTHENSSNIYSNFEHGDIELDIEFMMPKGSNSGIFFQSRYEIQLLDSWGVQNLTSQDCGSIYERWDDQKSEGSKGYEGHAPDKNASKAPGLWQHLHIKFKAPKFDAEGIKITNARFEEVTYNGVLIHKNVELSGPTRGGETANPIEISTAPLMIQGDHGPVAFRNFKYKLYGADTLTTTNITYDYYEVETPISALPNFDSLIINETGTTDVIDVNKLSKRRDGVAFVFNGTLKVIREGDYLFDLASDDGSMLFIDNDLIIDNNGKHDFESKKGLITLSKGFHQFKIDYFNYTWGKGLALKYEGPQQELRTLQGLFPYPTNYEKKSLLVDPLESPEMIRSFAQYGTEKRTHVISVGDPKGVHFSYDLHNGSLLKVWKGGFADVTEMWEDRGTEQLLVPQEMSLEVDENIIAGLLPESSSPYPQTLDDQMVAKGYEMNIEKKPVFIFQAKDALIKDSYGPNNTGDGLTRTIQLTGKKGYFSRAASGLHIQKVNNDYYVIDGKYYLRNLGSAVPFIREIGDIQELIYPLEERQKVQYSLLW